MIGFIYIMSNPAYPDSLKIGQTGRDPEERRKDLGSTGVLEDFVLEYRALTEDYESLEKEIHKSLADSRVRADREFFKVSVPEAINTIREIAGDRIETDKVFYVSPEELKRNEEEIRKQEEERLRIIDAKRKKVRLPNLGKHADKSVELVEFFVSEGDYVYPNQKIASISAPNRNIIEICVMRNGRVYELISKLGDKISHRDIILSLEDTIVDENGEDAEEELESDLIAEWEKNLIDTQNTVALEKEKLKVSAEEEKQRLIEYNKPHRKVFRIILLPFKFIRYLFEIGFALLSALMVIGIFIGIPALIIKWIVENFF
jgi:hypothetical protein